MFRRQRSLHQTQPAVVHAHWVWRNGRKSEQQRLEEEYQIRRQTAALPHTGAAAPNVLLHCTITAVLLQELQLLLFFFAYSLAYSEQKLNLVLRLRVGADPEPPRCFLYLCSLLWWPDRGESAGLLLVLVLENLQDQGVESIKKIMFISLLNSDEISERFDNLWMILQ